ncbi:MAG: trypsin-like peptidase domain-containing protein [Clostridiales bacterium]|jgi:serine protease Do|nr:trypsin-like peptidase domain-containing protein [Clostridiales bacterium]
MSEYNQYEPGGDDEFNRIQREISQNLASSPGQSPADALPEASPVFTADGAEGTPLSDGNLFAGERPPAEPARDARENGQDGFYLETVKHETDKKIKARFKRNLIVACAAAVIAAPLAGLFIGAGAAYAKYKLEGGGARGAAGASQAEDTVFAFTTNSRQSASAPSEPGLGFDFSGVIGSVEPAVVCITSTVNARAGGFFQEDDAKDGQGSGIIFDEDADNIYIVTNYHVVSGADQVGASIEGSGLIPASLVGAEESADLAVISLSKKDAAEKGVKSVVKARFGSSGDIKVGQTVFAIGNALGEGNSATMGIVSAKNRDINVDGLSLTVLQTDAAINPGNSGGPLINSSGEVVAINTAKFKYYAVEGTAYSITIDEAKPIIERLRNRTPKAFLGVMLQTLDEETAKMYNLPAIGAMVMSVSKNSPAEKAGIRANDIITGFDGKPVLDAKQATELVGECEVGKEVEVKVYRMGKGATTLRAVLTDKPASKTF